MNHDQSKPDALDHEQALLTHFRRHGDGEPSAELDARILAAASAAANGASNTASGTDKPALAADDRASWSERLHGWLFGTGRQRWSVAVAGLACLGVGLSLTWRTLEQAPDAYDAVPLAVPAPASAPMAAKRSESSEVMARQYAESVMQDKAQEQRKAAPQMRMQAAPSAMLAEEAPAAAMADLVAKAEPRDQLLELLALRRIGNQQAAAELLEQLQTDYPQLDIEAELVRLEEGAE